MTEVRLRAARAVCALHQGAEPCQIGTTASAAAVDAVVSWLRGDAVAVQLEREIGLEPGWGAKVAEVLASEIGGS